MRSQTAEGNILKSTCWKSRKSKTWFFIKISSGLWVWKQPKKASLEVMEVKNVMQIQRVTICRDVEEILWFELIRARYRLILMRTALTSPSHNTITRDSYHRGRKTLLKTIIYRGSPDVLSAYLAPNPCQQGRVCFSLFGTWTFVPTEIGLYLFLV